MQQTIDCQSMRERGPLGTYVRREQGSTRRYVWDASHPSQALPSVAELPHTLTELHRMQAHQFDAGVKQICKPDPQSARPKEVSRVVVHHLEARIPSAKKITESRRRTNSTERNIRNNSRLMARMWSDTILGKRYEKRGEEAKVCVVQFSNPCRRRGYKDFHS